MKTTNIFFLLTFFLFTISCKKEKETDNPNINHRTVNLEMKVSSYNADAEMSVDVNDDGMQDFEIELDLYKDAEDDYDYELWLDYEQSGNEFLTQEINSEEYVKQLNKNDLISGGSSTWYRYCNFFEIEKSPGNPEEKFGFAGNGDILIGVRFLIGTELHYGWMKINASSDYKTVTVKEVAYEIRPNVEVRAGEK
ncbi:MAG: hypothetical protein KA457_04620 [Chitinophagales bacterium]|nr:hypothetical protein [Chitinophagales bacterium]